MAENLLEDYRDNLFGDIPGDNKGLELVYVVGRLENNTNQGNYLKRTVERCQASRPYIRDTAVPESALLEADDSGRKTFVHLTEQGWKAYEQVKGLFDSGMYDHVEEKAIELRDLLLRWPTKEELETLTGTNIDTSMRSYLAKNCGWREPDQQTVESKRDEVLDLIRESIARSKDGWRSGVNFRHYDAEDLDPGLNAEIREYKSDNADKIEDIEVRGETERRPPEFALGANEYEAELTPEMQYLFGKQFLHLTCI